MDFWTADYTKKSYLAITSHFIDNEWRLHDPLLEMMEFDQRQTAENIRPILNKVFIVFTNFISKFLSLHVIEA